MNLMGSWPPSILNVIHHIQTHMHFWKIPSRLALLKKTVYLWKCFLYRHSYNLYGTICFCWIALLLFQDWLFSYLVFWPAAFDCMVIVMRCKIDESVICKTLLQWMDFPLKNAAVKNWSWNCLHKAIIHF